MLYNDSDANSEPRQKEKNIIMLESYENNMIYVKLKLDKIKQIVNKRSTSKKKILNNENNEDNEEVIYFNYFNDKDE